MACCPVAYGCDPATGDFLVGQVDTVNGGTTWYNLDGTEWAGDPATIGPCASPIDLCGEIATLPAVACDVADSLVTDCGVVPTDDLIPGHILGQCGQTGGVVSGGSSTSTCQVDLTNTNCRQDTYSRCFVRASVKICNTAGQTTTVTPVVNGTALTDQAVGSELEGCITQAIAFEVTDPTAVAANGGTASHTFSFDVTGTGSAEFSDWATECELVHT